MIGAPKTRHEIIDEMQVVINAVDQRGREMDERWGIGRLITIVPIEWAERFRSQRRKFLGAVWEYDSAEVTKHGEAMLRAYAKLDELASATHQPGPPDVWEFNTPDGLIVLVRDIRRASERLLQGRKGQVWSIDEIVNVIRAYPMLAAAKDAFSGAVIEEIRPPIDVSQKLDDELMEIPF